MRWFMGFGLVALLGATPVPAVNSGSCAIVNRFVGSWVDPASSTICTRSALGGYIVCDQRVTQVGKTTHAINVFGCNLASGAIWFSHVGGIAPQQSWSVALARIGDTTLVFPEMPTTIAGVRYQTRVINVFDHANSYRWAFQRSLDGKTWVDVNGGRVHRRAD